MFLWQRNVCMFINIENHMIFKVFYVYLFKIFYFLILCVCV